MSDNSDNDRGAIGRSFLPKGIIVAECCLLPLLVLGFLLSDSVSRLIAGLGFGSDEALKIWFLRDLSAFIVAKGIDPGLFGGDLQIFGAFVWLSLFVLGLRLISGPLLFGVIDARAAGVKTSASFVALLVGWLAAGPAALFASMHGSDSAPQLSFILRHSPRAYVRLDAFMFVMGAIFFVEGLLLFLQLIIRGFRERGSIS